MNVLKDKLHLIVIAAVFTILAGRYLWRLDSNVGYAPDQPIAFSHELHAGQYSMDCLYCHNSAEKGPHAGIPPMNVCIGCHSVVGLDKESIKELGEIYNGGGAVQWQRVHRLPDHVYFSHKWHLRAGVDCSECHGAVEEMPLVRQVNKLEMGDCLECHRRNNYTSSYVDSVLADDHGGYTGMYEKYPYMKYISSVTLGSSDTPLEADYRPREESHTPRATGVFPGHNAMTQCNTCHQ